MAKKLMIFAIAAIMMLGVFGLTGCDNVSLADYKVTKSNELQAYADAKGQSNYSEGSWTIICKAVTDGKIAINAAENKTGVDTEVITAKGIINAVEKEEEMANFILTISAEKTTLLQGEDFQVEMTFKNNSGEVVEISHTSSWILPFIAEWFEIESSLDVNLSILKLNEIVKISFNISCELPKGQHELTASAAFSLRQIGAEIIAPARQILVKSNIIIITVA